MMALLKVIKNALAIFTVLISLSEILNYFNLFNILLISETPLQFRSVSVNHFKSANYCALIFYDF